MSDRRNPNPPFLNLLQFPNSKAWEPANKIKGMICCMTFHTSVIFHSLIQSFAKLLWSNCLNPWQCVLPSFLILVVRAEFHCASRRLSHRSGPLLRKYVLRFWKWLITKIPRYTGWTHKIFICIFWLLPGLTSIQVPQELQHGYHSLKRLFRIYMHIVVGKKKWKES